MGEMNEGQRGTPTWLMYYDSDAWERAQQTSALDSKNPVMQKPRYPHLPKSITRLFNLYDRYNIYGDKL